MTDDTFIYIFTVQFCCLIALRLFFANKVRRGEGSFAFINKDAIEIEGVGRVVLKIMAWAFLILAVPTSLLSTPFDPWLEINLPSLMRLIGIMSGFIFLLLLFWVHSSLDRQWSTTLLLRTEHCLITAGPYHWIRHPMYSFGFLILISFFLMAGNTLILLSLICLSIMVYLRLSKEEKMLLNRFGDGYRKYMITTGRLLPRLISRPSIHAVTEEKDD